MRYANAMEKAIDMPLISLTMIVIGPTMHCKAVSLAQKWLENGQMRRDSSPKIIADALASDASALSKPVPAIGAGCAGWVDRARR